MIIYFNQCPSCINEPLKLSRQVGLELHSPLEERYVPALPRWGREANALSKATGIEMPFLYDPASNLVCPIKKMIKPKELDSVKNIIKSFWEQCLYIKQQ